MDILTELQKRFLSEIAKSSLRESFFLTGGTALSAFFLEHRLSEDLDFFTEEPERVQHVLPVLEDIVKRLGVRIEIRRQFRTFLEVHLHGQDEQTIKCDFAQDSPYRLQPKIISSSARCKIRLPAARSCTALPTDLKKVTSVSACGLLFLRRHSHPVRRESCLPK